MTTPEEYAEDIARAAFDARGQLEKTLGTPGVKPTAWYGMADAQRAGYRVVAVAVARRIAQLKQEGQEIPFKPLAKQAPGPSPKAETPFTQTKSVKASAAEVMQPGPVALELLTSIKSSLDVMATRMDRLEQRVETHEKPLQVQVPEPEPEGPNGKPA